MNPDQAKWEERYHDDVTPGDPEASVAEMLPLFPRGVALDIAAGIGRNSIALARSGSRVVAVDFARNAMSSLHRIARKCDLAIIPVVANLENGLPFQPQSFEVVINVSFLDRALVPQLKNVLRPGGLLLFDTFLVDQAAVGHPRDPRFLLEHYELRAMLSDMELLRYREGIVIYPGDKRSWRAVALARRRG